jgi:DNA-binding HxlR family transcriptional regulator
MRFVEGLDEVLQLLGDRWSLLIVAALAEGELAYGELSDRLGAAGSPIAPNILAARLRRLEAARLVAGQPYQERPRRLRYGLTADGQELLPALGALQAWSMRSRRSPRDDQTQPQVHDVCGTPVRWRPWCPTCERPADEPMATWV